MQNKVNTEKDIKVVRQEKIVKFMSKYVQIFNESGLNNLGVYYDEFTSRIDENLATLKQCLRTRRLNDSKINKSNSDLPMSPQIIQM